MTTYGRGTSGPAPRAARTGWCASQAARTGRGRYNIGHASMSASRLSQAAKSSSFHASRITTSYSNDRRRTSPRKNVARAEASRCNGRRTLPSRGPRSASRFAATWIVRYGAYQPPRGPNSETGVALTTPSCSIRLAEMVGPLPGPHGTTQGPRAVPDVHKRQRCLFRCSAAEIGPVPQERLTGIRRTGRLTTIHAAEHSLDAWLGEGCVRRRAPQALSGQLQDQRGGPISRRPPKLGCALMRRAARVPRLRRVRRPRPSWMICSGWWRPRRRGR